MGLIFICLFGALSNVVMKDERKVFVLGLLGELKEDLVGVPLRGVSRRVVLDQQMELVELTRVKLEDWLGALGPQDQELVLFYFKVVYPQFKGMAIYCHLSFGLLSELPLTGGKDLRRYYQGELADVERFFLRYRFHYGYFCLQASELDGLLFLPGLETDSVLLPLLSFDVPDGVPLTSYLFGMFIAREQLRTELLALLAALDLPAPVLSATCSVTSEGDLSRPFKWTSEVINLIELAHALHLKGAVNDGETGTTEFFEGLGDFFGVNLGVPKRGFEDLKARKRYSKTHFIDQLQQGLLDKISESDAWRGGSGKGMR